jgi:tetratricopeptide (TPR) repeat protein
MQQTDQMNLIGISADGGFEPPVQRRGPISGRRPPRRSAPRLAALALVLAATFGRGSTAARADGLAQARAQLQKGQYDAALRSFKGLLRGKTRGEALLGQAEALRQKGRYRQAAQAARAARRIRAVRGRAAVAHAEALLHLGKHAQAIRVLEKAVSSDAKNFAARARLGEAYQSVGKPLKAKVMWKDLYRDWDNGLMDKKSAAHTFLVGRAGEGEGNLQYASDAYEQALRLDPKLYRANLRWGRLFMLNYNVPDAERCFKDVLKHNPNHPDAWAGLAWVEWYAAKPKRARGRKHARKALALNPHHVEAMLYLASMHLYDAEYGRALILVERALKVNPNHLRALAHLAAVHYLRDKQPAYQAVEARALKINPRYSDFYYLISRFTTRHHLYADSVKLNKKAKAMDKDNARALAELGIALLRTGREGEGLFWLKEAWKIDKYNHRVLNLLNLYDELAKKYTTIQSGHFRFKVAKDEVKIIKRYVPGYLRKVLAHYMKKYHWKPPGPVQIELFESPQQFTVRTFGEPSHGGILGVCFGQVITAMSPSVGRANWAMVLHHELAHTVHIDISGARVPRWFTEGLAEYETIQARPEWRREHRLDVYRAIRHDVLAGIDELNYRFTHSKTPKGVVIAYFQSSQAVAFIAQRWGYKALNKALRLYGQARSTAEVIPAITGLSTTQFDKAFTAWLRKRYQHYDDNFDPLSAVVVPLAKLKKRAEAAKKNAPVKAGANAQARARARAGARAQAHLAVGYLIRRKLKKARAAIDAALARDAKEPVARFLKAEIAFRTRKRAEAEKILRALLAEGHDGYAVRMRLAALARKKKDPQAALAHYAAAKKLDPERSGPYDARIRVFAKLKKPGKVLEELAGLARLKEGSGSLLYSIVTRGAKLGRWDIVRKYGRQAREIQPFNLLVHEKYAWALKAAGKYKEAIFAFESALATIPDTMPPQRRESLKKKQAWIHLGIAECWAALRDPERARAAVLRAMDFDSNLQRAIDLRKKVDPDYRPGS